LFSGQYVAFSPFDGHALRDIIRRVNRPGGRICEIGSWLGNGSTRTIIEEITTTGATLFCIDHWRGSSNVSRHIDLVEKYDVFGTFRKNVAATGAEALVKPMVMSSQEAADAIKDGFFDLVFIDGHHSYDETVRDIGLWLPKVAPHGILCGHDCEGRASAFEYARLKKFRNDDTIEGNTDYPRIHPGVILAVEEIFGERARIWAETPITLASGQKGSSTIWEVPVSGPPVDG